MTTRVHHIPDARSLTFVHIALLASGIGASAIYGYLSLREDLLHPIKYYLSLYFIAFAIYLYVCGRLIPSIKARPESYIPVIFAFGILFRLLLVPSPPTLSTDIYRYIWDGRLTCHGINPYRWAPYNAHLASLRDVAIWMPMEYKAYQTVYMPISQYVFAGLYAVFKNQLWAYKLVYVGFDIGVAYLVYAILKLRGYRTLNVAWYLWCPLPITEVAQAGHQDSVGVFLLMLGIYVLLRRRIALSSILIVASGFTKGFAFLILPVFVRRFGFRSAQVILLALAVIGLPLFLCLPEFLHGMSQYLNTVHVNSGLFAAVHALFIVISPVYAYAVTSRISNIATVALIAWSVWTVPDTDAELLRRSAIVLVGCILVVPTLVPWYLLWILPLAVSLRKTPSTAIIALSGTTGMMYFYYFDDLQYWWVRALEYAPFYTLLVLEARSGYWSAASWTAGGKDQATGTPSALLAEDASGDPAEAAK